MWNETNGKAHSPVCLKLHTVWGGQQTRRVLRNLAGKPGNKIVTEGLDKHSPHLCLTGSCAHAQESSGRIWWKIKADLRTCLSFEFTPQPIGKGVEALLAQELGYSL